MALIRRGTAHDLDAIGAIQAACPEAAQWNPEEYAGYDVRVLEEEGRVAGFIAVREVAPGETELLNLAVAPEFRRRGIGGGLVRAVLRGMVFLEVRESNQAARQFYKRLGFQEVGVRQDYYAFPPEDAIVMKFHS